MTDLRSGRWRRPGSGRQSLYRRHGLYEYRNGFNGIALISVLIGIVAALIGRFVPAFEWLFKLAWFVGFFTAGALYVALMRSSQQIVMEANV